MADTNATARYSDPPWDQMLAIIAIAAIVFFVLYFFAILPSPASVIGFTVVSVLAYWRYRRLRPAAHRSPEFAESAQSEVDFARTLREIAPAALEQLPDPVLILDSSGRVLFANAASDALIGVAVEDRQISSFFRNPSLLEAVAKVLSGRERQIIDYSIPVPVERHIRASVSPIHAPAETLPGAVESATNPAALLVLHDLTSIKRSDQMRADFVANASHELRTPLASLSGFIETLRGHARNDEVARDRFLEIMQAQASRMGRLIDDLLSLSRIELNEHVPLSTPVDLIGVVRDVLDAAGPRAQDDNVTLRVTLEGAAFKPQPNHAMAWVLGERDDLVQVVQNLVDNAIKYGGQGGTVTIDLGVAAYEGNSQTGNRSSDPKAQKTYYISVQDQGDGIDRQHIPRLTERFYRVDIQQSRERGGTGLGLAIVKHIVNRHRGTLKIESELGRGSTFTVFFPTTQGPAASSPQNIPGDATDRQHIEGD